MSLLEREEEQRLARAYQQDGDTLALQKLTGAYIRLVVAQANRFRGYGLSLDDLIQEGTIGLMEAAKRFDPDRDIRFSTYATWWVRASMQDFILRNWSIVRTGTTAAHKSLFFNLKRLRAKLDLHEDRPLSLAEKQDIADEIGVKVRDVEAMEGRMSGADSSLNSPVADDSQQERQDLLVSQYDTPDVEASRTIDQDKRETMIDSALQSLSTREIYIIRQRHLQDTGKTLSELGKNLGVSKERVRQIESKALEKLKSYMKGHLGIEGTAVIL